MDKSLILNRIKLYLKLKNDKDLAAFLGIKPNVLSNWYKRDSIDYDIIFTKCDFIDKNFLIDGKQATLDGGQNKCLPCIEKEERIQELKETIAILKDHIALLKEAKNEQDAHDASVAAAG